VWLNSASHANHVENISQLITAPLSQTSENQIDDSGEFAMPRQAQVRAVVQRAFLSY